VLRIVQLSTADYVRDVLPHSADIWAGERSFADYAAEFGAVSASGFGRRRFRTLGLSLDGELVTSCKRYQRELRCGERTFRAAGIGAVFTPEAARGRGYATAFLGALLDAERANGTDLVYLFSDIHPAFYERLGFVPLPSRAIVLRADTLPHERIATRTLGDDDWPAIERCFAALDATRAFALTRPPLVWEWLRLRARSSESSGVLVRHRARTPARRVRARPAFSGSRLVRARRVCVRRCRGGSAGSRVDPQFRRRLAQGDRLAAPGSGPVGRAARGGSSPQRCGRNDPPALERVHGHVATGGGGNRERDRRSVLERRPYLMGCNESR
jgi:predicted N-acetyltransferase YhbS